VAGVSRVEDEAEWSLRVTVMEYSMRASNISVCFVPVACLSMKNTTYTIYVHATTVSRCTVHA
jgi:ribosomal protein S27E